MIPSPLGLLWAGHIAKNIQRVSNPTPLQILDMDVTLKFSFSLTSSGKYIDLKEKKSLETKNC